MNDKHHSISGRQFLVTGGCGYIGSCLVESLVDAGAARVSVLDPLASTSPRKSSSSVVTYVEDDLSDTERLRTHLRGIDRVFHFGASTDMRWRPGAELRDLERGSLATIRLLESMREEGVNELTYASSSAVYGDLAQKGVSENDGPLLPSSTYGAAKLAAEAWLSAFSTLFEWKVDILRFGNVIDGEMDRGVLFDVTRKLARGDSVLQVLGDGTQGRTYILRQDLIASILDLLDQPPEAGSARVINLSGEGLVDTLQLIRIACEASKLPIPKIETNNEHRGWPGDVPRVVLNLDVARELGLQVTPSTEAVRIAAAGLTQKFWEAAE